MVWKKLLKKRCLFLWMAVRRYQKVFEWNELYCWILLEKREEFIVTYPSKKKTTHNTPKFIWFFIRYSCPILHVVTPFHILHIFVFPNPTGHLLFRRGGGSSPSCGIISGVESRKKRLKVSEILAVCWYLDGEYNE